MNNELPVRKIIRLKDYNYSQSGYYFITICTQNKKKLLCRGEQCSPVNSSLDLTEIGLIVDDTIRNIPEHYANVVIDKYVIMPNHMHMIIILQNTDNGQILFAPTVARIIKQMKQYITKQIGYPIWQKSYYDHIIRTESEYQEIWQYIDMNPLKWNLDEYYNT